MPDTPAKSRGRRRQQARVPRAPSMLDAVLPIVVLIALLAMTIYLFGIDATNGPLQVALLLSAAFASLMAFKNGYTVAGVADAAVGGVTSAVGAIFILLAVGALIGTWNMAGTIPTIVDYGIRLVSPSMFYLTAAVVCALVGMVTGSSWTTAGTLGVAFVGMSNVMGLDDAIAAGAVICGAYFGDKMTPLSETTILVPKLVGGGLTVGRARPQHVLDRRPGLGVSLVIFLFLGLNADPDAALSTDAARAALATAFNIGFVNLLPLLLLVRLRDPQVPTLPVHPRIRTLRRHPGPVHPVGGGQGVRGRPVPRADRHLDRGHLPRDGHRVRQQLGCGTHRRAVHPWRDGKPADHDLAGAGRPVVRRRHGTRRLPPAPARPDRVPSQADAGR